jgi:predicted dehydrogenase
MNNWTRKEFLKASLVGGGVALMTRSGVAAAVAAPGSANGDVRLAIVGVNGKGGAHIKDFKKVAGARIVALCDVDSQVLAKRVAELAKDNIKVKSYSDYRKLLEDPSIDAVLIATPNHWHSLMTIWACQAGKDVYVEKPLSHNVWEGRKAVEAAKKYNRIVQGGTQSRSSVELQEAAAYLQAGKLGKIQWVRGLCYKPRPSIGKTTGPQAVPSHIDYDQWTGPAALVPSRRNSAENGPVHYDWHWFWNYGGGDIANQGIHQMDICRWMIGAEGLPASAMSFGGRYGYDDDAETPNTQVAVLNYSPAPVIFEVRGLPTKAGMKAMDAYRTVRGVGVVVQCENGYFAPGETGGGAIFDNNNKKVMTFSGAGGGGHQANFIAAVKSRKAADLNGKIENMHYSSCLCHLANISYRLGADKTNDAVRDAVGSDELSKEAFARMIDHLKANNVDVATSGTVMGPLLKLAVGAERFDTKEKQDVGYWANTMLAREYRKPYVVPEVV